MIASVPSHAGRIMTALPAGARSNLQQSSVKIDGPGIAAAIPLHAVTPCEKLLAQ
ncbi:hypothetical protein [Bradyrhizobium sp. ISRA464]|uniref:hypothetical protein n=1 Tax=Bradyrhizobium sp. ISRA464 TaxID=2866200 RepID=UPI0024795FDE|nr:hypothetical protein [Bradyrhizobium sp. ISRA464]WGS24247.1 hypothetical protein MTX19_20405 [Bradyrhizobium sp. ISRA464]